MARPSQRTSDELSEIYRAWMSSKKTTRREVANYLVSLRRFERPANEKQIRDIIKTSPFGSKNIMQSAEFLELQGVLNAGIRRSRELADVVRDCKIVRERFGWTPSSENSGRSQRKRQLESSGFKSMQMTSTIVNVLEHMETTTLLNDPITSKSTDYDKKLAQQRGSERQAAARKLYEVNEASQVSAIKSGSLEPVISSGFGPKTPHDTALDCQAHMKRIREALADHQGGVWLFASVLEEECVWVTRVGLDIGQGVVTDRVLILRNIRAALDIVADYFGIGQGG